MWSLLNSMKEDAALPRSCIRWQKKGRVGPRCLAIEVMQKDYSAGSRAVNATAERRSQPPAKGHSDRTSSRAQKPGRVSSRLAGLGEPPAGRCIKLWTTSSTGEVRACRTNPVTPQHTSARQPTLQLCGWRNRPFAMKTLKQEQSTFPITGWKLPTKATWLGARPVVHK